MCIRLKIVRDGRKPTRIDFFEHNSIEIKFLGNGSSLDDRRKDLRNLKPIEMETLLGRP